MEKRDIFRDITERTGGDIYLGVMGPVRSGKSTFITQFMEKLVLPNIKNPNDRDRARDELPQSGAGRLIMTTEPKFIPNEAVEIAIREGLKMRVRLVDCVGYTVPGALGYEDNEGPRMVRTPWFEHPVPFQEAAETGTRKVITDHATIGVVVTTDGSITEIPRQDYVDAEERVIWELKELGKPFVILLNSVHPLAEETIALAGELETTYDVPVLPVDCLNLTEDDILHIMEEALYEFPVAEVNVNLPRWVDELESEHWLRQQLENAVREAVGEVRRLRDINNAIEKLGENEYVSRVALKDMDLGTGTAHIDMGTREGLFHQILREISGLDISGDQDIVRWLRELAGIKKEWDKIAYGIQEVRNTGYGVVTPTEDEMELAEPELIKQGGRSGVRLKATAPSYHFIRADITTEVTPIIGTEKQCEDLVKYIMEEFEDNPQKIWQTNVFGKSLSDLVREGIQSKLYRMPENAQVKLQETVERIVNDGGGGLICIII
ncbi:stage IV sporulation protein A [Neomoorella thermoacetica]|uniref:Stage IV sporulation protein A n=3 Tax=Neomoorella thermoacetica TaxID=1525 RepID=A0A1D7XAX1_NEOTH|nr:stage IV sporulation protein A [Moorella thermoacetica]AKX96736.1 stage IV sporulation protein A [Moorella thermoacetica]AOQ24049.1 Stage IV sporulation protein A [Moorella thermoacetica]APC08489.1 stage IV sporulation protein A [Moorella thermoacetica]OIQ08470.1 stage IV sporulation protein A [Moorella thermoacetica]OIQ13001.1 stage IV sporulation protein A [Moorella thermoacetica]